jgi:hypothetical protein
VLYDTYDVTQTVKPGVNALAVELGNGWYNPLPLRMWGRFNLREGVDSRASLSHRLLADRVCGRNAPDGRERRGVADRAGADCPQQSVSGGDL